MNKQEKCTEIYFLKKQIDVSIHQKYHTIAQTHGLTLDQFHLLIELDELLLDVPTEDVGMPIGTIASQLSAAQNTISERVSRLEKKKLVERIPDQQDRRISRVILTQEGKELLEHLEIVASRNAYMEALNNLPENEITQFHATMQKILSDLTKSEK